MITALSCIDTQNAYLMTTNMFVVVSCDLTVVEAVIII